MREPEANCTITLTKEAWLSFLVYLIEFSDQTATDDIAKVVDESIKSVRAVILSRGDQSEHSIEFDRFKALDLFVHCKETREVSPEIGSVLKNITGQFKEFLIGGEK